MFATRKTFTRVLLPSSLLLVGTLLTGCSDESSAEESSGSGGNTQFDQALEYAECMRENGVPDFPDPQEQDGGVRMGGEGIDPNDPAFQEASTACRDKAPQGQGQTGGAGGGGGEPLDPNKVAEWAECIRSNGVPDFPDPEIQGGQMAIDFASAGLRMGDPKWEEARAACQDKWPGGGMTIQGGPQ